jgi:hypothetical protein
VKRLGRSMTFEAEGIRTAQRGADIAILVDYEFGDREAVGSHMLLAVGKPRWP